MKTWKIVLCSIGVIILLIVLAFSLEMGGLSWKRFFAPRHANVEREVFKETRPYNEGMIGDLQKYYTEYYQSEDEKGKQGIASIVQMRFSEYNEDRIESSELRNWLKEIRKGRLPE